MYVVEAESRSRCSSCHGYSYHMARYLVVVQYIFKLHMQVERRENTVALSTFGSVSKCILKVGLRVCQVAVKVLRLKRGDHVIPSMRITF